MALNVDYTQQCMDRQLWLDCLLELTSDLGPSPQNWGTGLGFDWGLDPDRVEGVEPCWDLR